MEALREYLKGVWRALVVYDIVIGEAGCDPDWDNELSCVFRYKEYGT